MNAFFLNYRLSLFFILVNNGYFQLHNIKKTNLIFIEYYSLENICNKDDIYDVVLDRIINKKVIK